jgi:hypothetical protein
MRLALSLCLFLSLSVGRAEAQDRARQTIDQMIEALGGEAFLNVKDIKTMGRFFLFKRGELAGVDSFADYIKFPDMERTEFGRDKKNLSIRINKGEEGWILEDKEVKPQPIGEKEDFIKQFKTSFDYLLRFVINHRQTTMQNVGGEIIDFKRVDVIELRDPEKNRIRFYVDRTSHLPIKLQVRHIDDPEVREERYGNWHEFQGVMTPLLISRFTDGVKTMEIRADSAEYNIDPAENLFVPVASK